MCSQHRSRSRGENMAVVFVAAVAYHSCCHVKYWLQTILQASRDSDEVDAAVVHKKLSCRWQTARRICANAMAGLTSPKYPSPYVLPCRISLFCFKECSHIQENPKMGERWAGGFADPPKTSPLLMCYHVKCGSCLKGVCTNRREPPKLESAGFPPRSKITPLKIIGKEFPDLL